MTVVEHLEELRYRVFISIVSIGLGAIGGWFLFNPALDLLRGPFCRALDVVPVASRPPTGCQLVFTGPVEPFLIKLKVVVFLGLFIALPVVLFQFWRFITPGLTKRERRLSVPFVVSSVFLFALGGFFAYLTLPRGLQFLLGFAGPGFVPQTMMACGFKPLIFVSWAVISVSVAPKLSAPTIWMPAPGAAFSKASLPVVPNATETFRMATFVHPFFFR